MTKYCFLMFCFFVFSTAGKSQSNIDVLHYKFAIEINDQNDNITGEANITVRCLNETNEIVFDLKTQDKNGKGMFCTAASAGSLSLHGLNYNNKYLIKLDKLLKVNDTVTFTLKYSGIPTDGLIISKNKYGNRTFFADNWPDRAHHWIPCVDDPADKASVEFLITAPSHYQVISNGIQIEETNLSGNRKLTHYREEVPLPTKVMVFGAADFAVNYVGDVDCIPVSSWVYPENKTAAFYDYAQAKEILAWHINYIGLYAYKKLANVQSKTKFGGMENAGAIFYAEDKITGKRQEERLLSHEIVHQWFGNMATEKSFAHLWLSEGFATYLTHLYVESKYGYDKFIDEMIADRQQVLDFVKYSNKPVVDSVSGFMELLSANSYQKGSWVLHMLRRQLGDSVFKKSIRLYYSTYAGKNAETKDLQKIFESVSGKDLEQFFKQWLFTAVNPKLKLSWSYDPTSKKISLNAEQLQNGSIFEMPVEFEIKYANGKSTIQKINITKKMETFELSCNSKPQAIIVDPNTSLLFEGTIVEIK